jgi:superfamily II DNA or RNA helicase
MATTFTPGNVVTARGRQWIVLPESEDDLLMVRPMGGLDDEVIGICTALEDVRSANFSLPDPEAPGDHSSCRLLRDAARLSTRSAAGPFRSFGKIGVEPRPYQLVPLLMALRQETVRLLIADDVGIGKTVEATLIAKELIERGEVTRMAILCPPHLAEQWQRELHQKFHITAELVLSSTVKRLERGLRAGESLFERHPFVIVSTDYIKSLRHRDDFLRACPELVIVDEAHTCTLAGGVGRSRQARFDLLQRIAADAERHLILVTATPHSGNEDAFRSLLSLLDKKFAELPTDMEADSRSQIRAELARHLVQRLRGNVIEQDKALDTTTTFPDREDAEESYKLSPAYKAFFRKALDFVNEMVQDESGNGRTRRVRWWSALALLRAMASSPAAAASTLRKRAETATAADAPGDEADPDAIDEIGRQTILDEGDDESVEFFDGSPGADVYDDEAAASARLRSLARDAEKLFGDDDLKLEKLVTITKKLVKDGYQPIVFCRFIDTADYVASHLRSALKGVEVASITGTLPPKEREDRIKALAEHPKRVLVCTDCLSEGVNLQTYFNAVVHYDLSWNPTRHDQREGRVDRFGQASPKVRVVTLFGVDNKIDGVVLEVLLRKHKSIKSDLGIAVAVPGGSEDVIKALFEGMELRGQADTAQLFLPGMDDRKETLHTEWENARDKEKKSRARFAQLGIKTEEIAAELNSVRRAIGAGTTVERFLRDVFHLAGVPVMDKSGGVLDVPLDNKVPRALRHALGREKPLRGRFDLPVSAGVEYLSRTHPIVEGLASWVLDTALDDIQAAGERPIARRSGVCVTSAVTEATTLLLVRFRHHLHVVHRDGGNAPLLAEEVMSLGFTGSPTSPRWLELDTVRGLLEAVPSANLPDTVVKQQLRRLLQHEAALREAVNHFATERSARLVESHERVRKSVKMTGKVTAEPVFPVDFLGCFILVPENI